MLFVYTVKDNHLVVSDAASGIPPSPVWCDLLHPTEDEEKQVEASLGINVPTQEEMKEIEVSSRLYREDGALFLTATLMVNADSEIPEAHPVTFVLTPGTLVTIRYSEPTSFNTFASWAVKSKSGITDVQSAFVGLLGAVLNRTADILERIALDLDAISVDVLRRKGKKSARGRNLQVAIQRIGHQGDLTSKASESLLSLHRLSTFLCQEAELNKEDLDVVTRLRTFVSDVTALADHASFLSNKTNFLLEATLGMINIEQNATIKIFSVVAVIFLPPTLIASVYGMNFKHMPELSWVFGYPFALAVMVVSAIIPFGYFKWKRWL